MRFNSLAGSATWQRYLLLSHEGPAEIGREASSSMSFPALP